MRIESEALLVDQYELTMAQAYLDADMHQTATFEFFARKLPASRNFFVASGLEQVLEYFDKLKFTDAELDWLSRQGTFSRQLIDWLGEFQFNGEVHAMPEGTIFFPNEPILRVTAPLPQSQLVESRVINLLQFQTLIVSKAIRCTMHAPDKTLVDYGFRRAHGAEAGVLAARASYLAGFAGTSNMLAGQLFGIPLYGTMAHSFIQSHKSELEAFETFARANPKNAVLLIDTYDTESGARLVVDLAHKLTKQGIQIQAVRLDSGDLAAHAFRVREIRDDGGLDDVRILASGGVDEHKLRDMMNSNAPIDGFGIGTDLTTSKDAPALDCAYKLQQFDGRPCMKTSEGKSTWPGVKQVFRVFDDEGLMAGDTVALEHEHMPGDPLLQRCMAHGQRTIASPTLDEIRDRVCNQLKHLPVRLKSLDHAIDYPVTQSSGLIHLIEELTPGRSEDDIHTETHQQTDSNKPMLTPRT